MKSHARIIRVTLLLNLAFWTWFWADVWRHTITYADRTPRFEETLPVYKFGGQALPPEAERNFASFRSMLLFQGPSFFVVGRITNGLTSGAWDRRVGGLSIGACVLFGTTVLSFLLWGLVALLVGWAVGMRGGGQTTPVHRSA